MARGSREHDDAIPRCFLKGCSLVPSPCQLYAEGNEGGTFVKGKAPNYCPKPRGSPRIWAPSTSNRLG